MLILVLVGEAASGKSTLEKCIVDNTNYSRVISYTTRPPREGEVNGVDYHFITDEEFSELSKEGFFIEVGEYRGWKYGSSKFDFIKSDNQVIVLTPPGLRSLKKYIYKNNINDIEIISVHINVNRKDRLIKLLSTREDIEEQVRRSSEDVGMFCGIDEDVDITLNNHEYRFNASQLFVMLEHELEDRGVTFNV